MNQELEQLYGEPSIHNTVAGIRALNNRPTKNGVRIESSRYKMNRNVTNKVV